jgi:hypothetical protein
MNTNPLVADTWSGEADDGVDRSGRGARKQLVLPGHVRQPAVATYSRRTEGIADPAAATRGIQNEVGVQPVPVNTQPDRTAGFRQHAVSVPDAELDPGFRSGGGPEDPLENHATTVEARWLCLVGKCHRCGACRDELLPHIGDLGKQGLDHLLPEPVRVMELHDAFSVPTVPIRPGIAINEGHRMATACQGHAEIESRRPGTHNGRTHVWSPFSATSFMLLSE